MPYSEYAPRGVEFQEKEVQVSDGVVLKVVDFKPSEEKGPIVVFVAGWISLIRGWKEVLQELTPGHRVLYLETREKKSADLPDGPYPDFSVHRMAKDIEEVVEKLVPEDKEFAFAGSSLGSTVVLDYISMDVRQPCTALLVGPVPQFNFPAWSMPIIRYCPPVLYMIVKPIIKLYLKYFRVDRKNEPEQIDKYYGTLDAAEPRRLKANACCLAEYSLWEKLPMVKAPVVVIGAKTDSLHGLESLEKIVELMPAGEMVIMESNKDAHSKKAGEVMVRRLKKIDS